MRRSRTERSTVIAVQVHSELCNYQEYISGCLACSRFTFSSDSLICSTLQGRQQAREISEKGEYFPDCLHIITVIKSSGDLPCSKSSNGWWTSHWVITTGCRALSPHSLHTCAVVPYNIIQWCSTPLTWSSVKVSKNYLFLFLKDL